MAGWSQRASAWRYFSTACTKMDSFKSALPSPNSASDASWSVLEMPLAQGRSSAPGCEPSSVLLACSCCDSTAFGVGGGGRGRDSERGVSDGAGAASAAVGLRLRFEVPVPDSFVLPVAFDAVGFFFVTRDVFVVRVRGAGSCASAGTDSSASSTDNATADLLITLFKMLLTSGPR